MSSSKYLQAAGFSIASNISVQILTRALTFTLRAISLKYLQSSALSGIIHVRLALLYTTLQLLSRESFRRACLGQATKNDQKTKKIWSRIVNTIWLGLPLSIVLSVPLAYIWNLYLPSKEDLFGTNTEDYRQAVLVTCLAVIIEMLAEPCYIYAQARGIIKHNPSVEIISIVSKCLLSFLFVMECSRYRGSEEPSYILTKTAISQIIASVISVIYSYSRLCRIEKLSTRHFLPSFMGSVEEKTSKRDSNDLLIHKYFDETSLKLSSSFMLQTFLKQLLTESERYVMTFLNIITLSEQGVYDVISNLGSLVARLVFKPIEESGYTLFTQLVKRDEIVDIRRFYWVQEYLIALNKLMLLLGLVVLTLGYNYVPLIVLYGGDKLNNPVAFNLMKWQLFYTPFIALNGVTECFTFAVMSASDIERYNMHLIKYSIVFLTVVYMTNAYLGSACFMLANCCVMTLRIYFSYKLIQVYFKKHDYSIRFKEILPSLTTLISLGGVFIFLSLTQHYLQDFPFPVSLGVGAIFGLWCLYFIIHVVMCHEETLVNFVSRLFKLKI